MLTLDQFRAPIENLLQLLGSQQPYAVQWDLTLAQVQDLVPLLASVSQLTDDEALLRIYNDTHAYGFRPKLQLEGIAYATQLGYQQSPLGWLPLHRAGFGLVLGHCIPTVPKPALPDSLVSYVMLDIPDYLELQSLLVGKTQQVTQAWNETPIVTAGEKETLLTGDLLGTIRVLMRLFPGERSMLDGALRAVQSHSRADQDWVAFAQHLSAPFANWFKADRRAEAIFLLSAHRTYVVAVDAHRVLFSRNELHCPTFKAGERSWISDNKVIPLYVRNDVVVVGTPYATQEARRSAIISALAGYRVFFCIITEQNYQELIPTWMDAERRADANNAEGEPILPYDGVVTITVDESKASKDTHWVQQFVGQFIAQAVDRGASDVHIEPFGYHFRIRFRIDGLMTEPYDHFPLAFCPFVVRRIKTLANMDISNSRDCQDGRVKFNFRGRAIDFRIATMPVATNSLGTDGESCTIRVLDAQAAPKRLDEAVTSVTHLAQLRSKIKEATGMILMTGPTGCGKSTTLYALLNELNTIERKILTIEDPVERRIEGISQTQIIPPNTFALSLRVALRMDPDVILVGEIRDEETGELGIKAAQTGHLVLSTLHANSCLSTLTRLNQLGVKYSDMANALLLVSAQRLIRRLCLGCRNKIRISQPLHEAFLARNITSTLIRDGYTYQSRGCASCHGMGYRGRLAVMEILDINTELKDAIARGLIAPGEFAKLAVAAGFVNLYHGGLLSVSEGYTDLREVTADLNDTH